MSWYGKVRFKHMEIIMGNKNTSGKLLERDANRITKLHHNEIFGSFAEHAASWAGTPLAFILAMGFVLAWVAAGPMLHYWSGWEAIMSTVPGVITFLLVFIIQNSQNRATMAIQLKLNELIRATDGAHTMMLNLEKLSEEELFVLCEEYELLAQAARKKLKKGETDLDIPEMSLSKAP